jgi:hypothetical protein
MAEDAPKSVPDWFWDILDSTRPNLQRLIEWLEAATREQLIEFQRSYDEAAQEVCDFWSGPTVDGVTLSEDDTEDFCRWIVSQGRIFWEQVVKASDLESFVRIYWAAERPNWDSFVINPMYRGFQSPGIIGHAVFESRFHESLDDHVI